MGSWLEVSELLAMAETEHANPIFRATLSENSLGIGGMFRPPYFISDLKRR